MGGGGGLSPISIISDLVFGSALSALAGTAAQEAGTTTSTTDTSDDAAQEEAEARRKADRRKAEASLLAKARQADRAELATRDAVAETLGSPTVAAVQLKARLGQ